MWIILKNETKYAKLESSGYSLFEVAVIHKGELDHCLENWRRLSVVLESWRLIFRFRVTQWQIRQLLGQSVVQQEKFLNTLSDDRGSTKEALAAVLSQSETEKKCALVSVLGPLLNMIHFFSFSFVFWAGGLNLLRGLVAEFNYVLNSFKTS